MKKNPVVMIHGAFCGPAAMEGLKAVFEAAGYPVTTPCLRFHDTLSPPAALGLT
ncbi:MAG: alpha/beta hydrolase, partial [Rubrivivax sp.]